jgi:hypothetical protein
MEKTSSTDSWFLPKQQFSPIVSEKAQSPKAAIHASFEKLVYQPGRVTKAIACFSFCQMKT